MNELREQRKRAYEALMTIQGAINRRKQVLLDRINELKREADREIEQHHGKSLREAQGEVDRIQALIDDEEAAAAIANQGGLPYPVGTKVIEWRPIRYSRDFGKTGSVGVIEIWTRHSHGQRRGPHFVYPGNPVIRYLKKDGEPGRVYEVLTEYNQARWLPAGVECARSASLHI